jgi:hypothetical protein
MFVHTGAPRFYRQGIAVELRGENGSILSNSPHAKPIDPAPSAEFIPLEITYFVKESGLLTKKIHLAADGTVIDSSEGRMCRGPLLNAYNSNGSSASPARK